MPLLYTVIYTSVIQDEQNALITGTISKVSSYMYVKNGTNNCDYYRMARIMEMQMSFQEVWLALQNQWLQLRERKIILRYKFIWFLWSSHTILLVFHGSFLLFRQNKRLYNIIDWNFQKRNRRIAQWKKLTIQEGITAAAEMLLPGCAHVVYYVVRHALWHP